jgi:hypothetical protein
LPQKQTNKQTNKQTKIGKEEKVTGNRYLGFSLRRKKEVNTGSVLQTGEKNRDDALEAIKGNLDGFSRDAKMHPTPASHPKKQGTFHLKRQDVFFPWKVLDHFLLFNWPLPVKVRAEFFLQAKFRLEYFKT